MTPRNRARAFLLARIALASAVLLGFAWFVRELDGAMLLRTLRRASIPLVVAAALINLVLHIGWKAVRWRVMLAGVARIPLLRLYRYTITNYAVSTILPARLGEVARVWLIKRREGVPATTTAAVALGEKVLELVSMLVMVAPIPWLLPSLPSWVGRSILALAALGVAALVLGWIALWWLRRDRIVDGQRVISAGTWRARFAAGVASLGQPGTLALGFLASLGAWATDLAAILLLLRALDIHVPWAAGLLVLLTVNLAVAMPSTPAQVGAFEIGGVVALELLGVPRAEALAFTLLYHAIQVVPMALIGLAEVRLVAQLRAEAQLKAGPSAPHPP